MTDDTFYPYEFDSMAKESDFSIEALADYLKLNKLQKRLLQHYLRRIEIKVWITDNDDADGPHMGLSVFDESDVDGNGGASVVSSANLTEMLKKAIDFRYTLDTEKEIAVLERLRDIAQAGIDARRKDSDNSA